MPSYVYMGMSYGTVGDIDGNDEENENHNVEREQSKDTNDSD